MTRAQPAVSTTSQDAASSQPRKKSTVEYLPQPIPAKKWWTIVLRRSIVVALMAVIYTTLFTSYFSHKPPTFSPTSEFPDLYEASIADLQAGLGNGLFTSVDLVKVWARHHAVSTVLLTYRLPGILRTH